MDRDASGMDYQGILKVISRVTNEEAEEKGGFLYIHNIARASVYWWLCDASIEAGPGDKVIVVCDIAIPSEPSDEPEVAVGEETSITFPVALRRLDPALDEPATLAEAERIILRKVAEGADDFEGLESCRVEIEVRRALRESSEAA